jgi:hypothetical protein
MSGNGRSSSWEFLWHLPRDTSKTRGTHIVMKIKRNMEAGARVVRKSSPRSRESQNKGVGGYPGPSS